MIDRLEPGLRCRGSGCAGRYWGIRVDGAAFLSAKSEWDSLPILTQHYTTSNDGYHTISWYYGVVCFSARYCVSPA